MVKCWNCEKEADRDNKVFIVVADNLICKPCWEKTKGDKTNG